jgi:small-conductance mechanosensitive channel
MKKIFKKIALADYMLGVFVALILIFGIEETRINGKLINQEIIIFSLALLAIYYILWNYSSKIILGSELVDDSADKEEVDKEISLIIVLAVFLLIVNNLPSENSIDASSLANLNKLLYFSLLVALELLIFSSISYIFNFKKNSNNNNNNNNDEHCTIDGDKKICITMYDEKYTCEEALVGQPSIKKDKLNNEPIAPIKLFMNITRIVLVIIAIVSFPLIFELKGANSIRNLAASAGGSLAILAFVFRESSKSIVAGIRLWKDDLIEIGDNVVSKKLEIDGKVEGFSTTNIKVLNNDNTITNVPISLLLASPFYNTSDRVTHGRRINLSIQIYIESIEKLEIGHPVYDLPTLQDYFNCKKISRSADKSLITNKKPKKEEMMTGRRHTNLGAYKAYLKTYLYCHGLVEKEKQIIVRSLNHTSTYGFIPIQIRAYIKPKYSETSQFRTIESDIMDHALATLNVFDLSASKVWGEDERIIDRASLTMRGE